MHSGRQAHLPAQHLQNSFNLEMCKLGVPYGRNSAWKVPDASSNTYFRRPSRALNGPRHFRDKSADQQGKSTSGCRRLQNAKHTTSERRTSSAPRAPGRVKLGCSFALQASSTEFQHTKLPKECKDKFSLSSSSILSQTYQLRYPLPSPSYRLTLYHSMLRPRQQCKRRRRHEIPMKCLSSNSLLTSSFQSPIPISLSYVPLQNPSAVPSSAHTAPAMSDPCLVRCKLLVLTSYNLLDPLNQIDTI